MSKVTDIKTELYNVYQDIARLASRRNTLLQQLRAAVKEEFERRHGVKPGDLLTSRTGSKYIYEQSEVVDDAKLRIYARKLNQNGTPCKRPVWMFQSEFVVPKAGE